MPPDERTRRFIERLLTFVNDKLEQDDYWLRLYQDMSVFDPLGPLDVGERFARTLIEGDKRFTYELAIDVQAKMRELMDLFIQDDWIVPEKHEGWFNSWFQELKVCLTREEADGRVKYPYAFIAPTPHATYAYLLYILMDTRPRLKNCEACLGYFIDWNNRKKRACSKACAVFLRKRGEREKAPEKDQDAQRKE